MSESKDQPRTLSPDGNWWWDGQQWQPVQRPLEPPPLPPLQPEPPQRSPSKRSVRLQLLIGGIIGLVVLMGVCIAAVAGSGNQQQKPTATATPVLAVASAAPTAKPTAKPTAVPTAAPTPDRGPQIMMQQQGSGIANSTEFNAPSHWQLTYSYDCSSFGFKGNFQVYLYQGGNLVNILANDLGTSGSKTTDVYQGGQHLHLEMNSECSWSVKATG